MIFPTDKFVNCTVSGAVPLKADAEKTATIGSGVWVGVWVTKTIGVGGGGVSVTKRIGVGRSRVGV